MLKKDSGFSLVELIVVMAIFVVVIGITGDAFNRLLKVSSIQVKTSESQIAGIVGLEIFRRDLTSAGYGLPWSFQNPLTVSYVECTSAPLNTFNDAPGNAPRPFISKNYTTTPTNSLNDSTYLVIKSISIAGTAPARKWTYISYTSATMAPHSWSTASDNFVNGDKVIVIKPTVDASGNPDRQLVMNSLNNVFTTYNSAGLPSVFSPAVATDTYYLYGIDPTSVTMPFNRADYFIDLPAVMPQRCAPHTGILYKGIVSQAGTIPAQNKLPLLDCVADLQVIFDTNGVSTDNLNTLTGATPTASDIRQNVQGIKVYILTHEGGKDSNYTYPNGVITVGESGLGRDFHLDTVIGADWQRYRWKVYVLSVTPKNLNAR